MDYVTKYWADLNNYDKQHPVTMVEVRADQSPVFNLSILKENIDNVDKLNDVELHNFITKSFKSILRNLFGGEDSQKYIKSFQQPRFLDAFTQVVCETPIDKNDAIAINTMCYHYLTLDKPNQDPLIISRMLKLSSITNRAFIPGLLGLGISNELASMLLIARFSDMDLNICVKRMNFIIITQPIELLNDKLVEEIIKRLYNVYEIYDRIFQYFMIDILPEYDDNDEKTWWITDDISEANSILNLAMLNILDNLPTQTIRRTILEYAEGQRFVYTNKPVRFSLRNLSEDYYRINNVVNELMYVENVDVP